jgi:hypothetical protein
MTESESESGMTVTFGIKLKQTSLAQALAYHAKLKAINIYNAWEIFDTDLFVLAKCPADRLTFNPSPKVDNGSIFIECPTCHRKFWYRPTEEAFGFGEKSLILRKPEEDLE